MNLAALAIVLELRKEVALKLPQRVWDALADLGQHWLEGNACTFRLQLKIHRTVFISMSLTLLLSVLPLGVVMTFSAKWQILCGLSCQASRLCGFVHAGRAFSNIRTSVTPMMQATV